jgi:NitT/TauT family transport system substrate-binding protein
MTQMPRPCRRWTLPLAVLALCLALPGCEAPPPAPESLVVAEAHLPVYGLLYIAEREGLFHDAGLTVTFQRHDTGRDALAAVVAGQADVATPYDTPVVINIQQGRPIRVLSTLAVTNGYTAVVARADRGITEPVQLRGKRIAVPIDTSADYLLSLLLANAGVAPAEVQRVPLMPAAATAALIQGQVDAAAIWSPFTQQAETALGSAAVKVFTSPLYLETITLSTIEPVLRARPEALKRLLRALVRAEDLALREPERALQDVLAVLDDLPPDGVREHWQRLQPQIRLDNLLLATLTGELKWYAAVPPAQPPGEAPVLAIDPRPYLAPELLRAVRPQAVTLTPAP